MSLLIVGIILLVMGGGVLSIAKDSLKNLAERPDLFPNRERDRASAFNWVVGGLISMIVGGAITIVGITRIAA